MYHSTLGWRVIKKKKGGVRVCSGVPSLGGGVRLVDLEHLEHVRRDLLVARFHLVQALGVRSRACVKLL